VPGKLIALVKVSHLRSNSSPDEFLRFRLAIKQSLALLGGDDWEWQWTAQAIINNCVEEVRSKVLSSGALECAEDLWECLATITVRAKRGALEPEHVLQSPQGRHESLEEFIHRLEWAAGKLEWCGSAMLAAKLLQAAMPELRDPIIFNLRASGIAADKVCNPKWVTTQLRAVRAQVRKSRMVDEQREQGAFVAGVDAGPRAFRGKCFGCDEVGHMRSDCPHRTAPTPPVAPAGSSQ
jgi:hypothetical protein